LVLANGAEPRLDLSADGSWRYNCRCAIGVFGFSTLWDSESRSERIAW